MVIRKKTLFVQSFPIKMANMISAWMRSLVLLYICQLLALNVAASSSIKTQLSSKHPLPICSVDKWDDQATMSCTFYRKLPDDVENRGSITSLNMGTNNSLQIIKNHELMSANFTSLRTLVLSNCNLRLLEPYSFHDIPLSYLDISHNFLRNLDPIVFQGLPYLRILNMSNNPIHSFSGFPMFPSLPKLERLRLSHCNLALIQNTLFEKLDQLRRLDLSNNELTTLSVRSVRNLRHITSLELGWNPWVCDCTVLFLRTHFRSVDNIGTLQNAVCNNTKKSVKHLMNVPWSILEDSQLTCQPSVHRILYGTSTSIEEVYLHHVPLSKVANNSSVQVRAGVNVIFECQYNGFPEPDIIWKHNNYHVMANIQNQTNLKSRSASGAQFLSSFVSAHELGEDRMDTEYEDVKHFKKTLIIQNIKVQDSGNFTCELRSVNGETLTRGIVISAVDNRNQDTKFQIDLVFIASVLMIASIPFMIFHYCCKKVVKKVSNQVHCSTVPWSQINVS